MQVWIREWGTTGMGQKPTEKYDYFSVAQVPMTWAMVKTR